MADEPATPAGDEPAPEPEAPGAETEPDKPTDDGLPPEVKEILAKERKAARDAEKRAKAAEKALTGATTELDKFRESQLSEQEKAVKAARDEGYAEGRSKSDKRLIRAEVIAAAAGKAADPSDVYALLAAAGALDGVEIGEDGGIDSQAIGSAVAALLEDKPNLAASSTPVRDPDFGARPPAAPAADSNAAMDSFIRQAAGRR